MLGFEGIFEMVDTGLTMHAEIGIQSLQSLQHSNRSRDPDRAADKFFPPVKS